MRRAFLVVCLILAGLPGAAAQSGEPVGWQARVQHDLPLLGHRNWILIVDSAYPLQSSAGVETIETNADLPDVAFFVLGAVNRSIHVRPEILMDAELPYVPEADAPGVSAYRTELAKLLAGAKVESVPHEQLIGRVDEAGKTMRVLVLKTRMTVPYSSIFLRLNCKYWSDDAEKRLRAKMASGRPANQ